MVPAALEEYPASHDEASIPFAPTPQTARILHVINGEHYAGAERVQDLLALELGRLGFEVGFACLKPDKFPGLRQAKQAPLYEFPMRSRLDLRPAGKIARLVRREGYDLIHSHVARTALIAAAAARLAAVPLVHHVHSPTARDSTRPLIGRLNAAIERISLRRASALIPVSRSLAEHVRRRGFPETLICVVPNGVPTRTPRRPREAPGEPWTLGTVALFRPRKGLEVLLEALAGLRSQGYSLRLRAVGRFEDPGYESRIRVLAERLGVDGAIDWTGFTQDVDAELAQMDVCVLPSLFGEGLPMVVLEAMAAGVPVVATRVEGTPEAIRDGIDGLLCRPDDPDDLAEAIGRIVSGRVDWHTLREAALKRQAEQFSQQSMAAGVAEVYRRILQR